MKRFIAALFCVIISSFSICGCAKKAQPVDCAYNGNFSDYSGDASVISYAKTFASDIAVVPVDLDNSPDSYEIVAESALLINITDSEVLFSKNPHNIQYPASTTKVMTALVSLENATTDVYTVGEEILITEENAVTCDYRVGDVIPYEVVLHGALLRSGNDAAAALAMCAAKSLDEFCDMMNARAVSVGATHTNYVNVHGLFEAEHVTTPYDLYLIFNEAIKNKTFLNTISKSTYQNVFKRITSYKEYRIIADYTSTNPFFSDEATAPEHVCIIGGKSGYTAQAGRHYVLLCESGGEKYIALVMKTQDKSTLSADLEYLLSLIPNTEPSDEQQKGAE